LFHADRRTDKQTDKRTGGKHDEANSRFLQYCELVKHNDG